MIIGDFHRRLAVALEGVDIYSNHYDFVRLFHKDRTYTFGCIVPSVPDSTVIRFNNAGSVICRLTYPINPVCIALLPSLPVLRKRSSACTHITWELKLGGVRTLNSRAYGVAMPLHCAHHHRPGGTA